MTLLHGDSLKTSLTHKVGPLPAWGWAVAAIGGYAVFRLFHHSSGDTGELTPGIYDLGPGGSGGVLPGGGGGGGGGGGVGGGDTPNPTPTPLPVPTPVPTPTPIPTPNPIPNPVPTPTPTPSVPTPSGGSHPGVPYNEIIGPTQADIDAMIHATLGDDINGVGWDPAAGAYHHVGDLAGIDGGHIDQFQGRQMLESADPNNAAQVQAVANNLYRGDIAKALKGIKQAKAEVRASNATYDQARGIYRVPNADGSLADFHPTGTYTTVGQLATAVGGDTTAADPNAAIRAATAYNAQTYGNPSDPNFSGSAPR